MDNDLISRSELKKTLTRLHWTVEAGCWSRPYLDRIIDDIPTVERPQGEWITNREYIDKEFNGKYEGNCFNSPYNCSCCGYSPEDNRPNYCPNCGADMRGKEE